LAWLAGEQFAHLMAEGHFAAGLMGFVLAVLAVCWCWINYSWFALAYDTDDWAFRVATMVQMVGVIIGTQPASMVRRLSPWWSGQRVTLSHGSPEEVRGDLLRSMRRRINPHLCGVDWQREHSVPGIGDGARAAAAPAGTRGARAAGHRPWRPGGRLPAAG
jgi:hypothetical protein